MRHGIDRRSRLAPPALLTSLQRLKDRNDPQAKLAVAFIHLYRGTAYPVYRLIGFTGQRSICKLQPSCSHYGEEAVLKHGLGTAIVITAARLMWCDRLESAHDPVPDPPYSPTLEEWVAAGQMLALSGVVMLAGARIGKRIAG